MKCMHMKTFLLRTSKNSRSTLPSNFAYSTPGLELTGILALVSKVKRILVLIMSGVTRPLSSRLYICLLSMVRDEPQHALATCCSSNSNSNWRYWFHRSFPLESISLMITWGTSSITKFEKYDMWNQHLDELFHSWDSLWMNEKSRILAFRLWLLMKLIKFLWWYTAHERWPADGFF